MTWFAPAPETARFVADLLSYMTLDEKLGQLDLFHAADDPRLEQAIVAGRVGGIAGGAHAVRWQGLATERSRLGIPLLLTGALPRPVLSQWALAATWDEEVARAAGAAAARAALDCGCNAIAGPHCATTPGSVGSDIALAACEPHLLARLAGAFCMGAGSASGGGESDGVLAMPSLATGGSDGDDGLRVAALELAGAGVGAIDAPGLDTIRAARAGFGGLLVAECARIAGVVAKRYGTTRAASWLEAAERALAEGLLSDDEIGTAASGVLAAKHGMGLFREPHRMTAMATPDPALLRPADCRRAAMVLLRNEAGLLPLSPVSDRVLVVGPTDGAAGICAEALNRAGIGFSAIAGLATRRPGESWVDPATGDPFAQALTRDAAKRADFAIVVLEERMFAVAAPGEWRRPGPAVTALLRALAPAGSRLVALLAIDEPVDLGDIDQHFAAVLQCWGPGEGLEEALGDLLSGRAGPQGRMPASAGRFAFGQGLSYGETSFSQLAVKAMGDHVNARLSLANTGSFAARETVQVYVGDRGGDPRLAAYRHVVLAPGESAQVEFALRLDELGTFGDAGWRELSPGPYEILVGKDLRRTLAAQVDITPALARAIVTGRRGFLRLVG